MVFDRIEHLGNYLDAERYQKLAPILAKINPDTPDGKIEVDGDNMYISVQSYQALPAEQCRIEAHDRYIDIQSVISGCEGVGIFRRADLTLKVSYNDQKDVMFFETKGAVPIARVAVYPRYFVKLEPQEAHNPKQQADPNEPWIRKFVIKLKV